MHEVLSIGTLRVLLLLHKNWEICRQETQPDTQQPVFAMPVFNVHLNVKLFYYMLPNNAPNKLSVEESDLFLPLDNRGELDAFSNRKAVLLY